MGFPACVVAGPLPGFPKLLQLVMSNDSDSSVSLASIGRSSLSTS